MSIPSVIPAVCFESASFSLSSERTSIEAAEQTPPRAGPAQAAGATNDHAQARGARRSPTRAGGFVFAEPMAPAPLLSVPVAMPRTPETYS